MDRASERWIDRVEFVPCAVAEFDADSGRRREKLLRWRSRELDAELFQALPVLITWLLSRLGQKGDGFGIGAQKGSFAGGVVDWSENRYSGVDGFVAIANRAEPHHC